MAVAAACGATATLIVAVTNNCDSPSIDCDYLIGSTVLGIVILVMEIVIIQVGRKAGFAMYLCYVCRDSEPAPRTQVMTTAVPVMTMPSNTITVSNNVNVNSPTTRQTVIEEPAVSHQTNNIYSSSNNPQSAAANDA